MAEALPTELDLFSAPHTMLGIGDFRYEKIKTTTTLSKNTNTVAFTVNEDGVNYTSLQDSFMMIKAKIVKNDGTNLDANAKVGLVQNPINSIFKAIHMKVNDVNVSPPENNMHYISFFTKFFLSDAAKKSYLTLGLWYDDDYENLTKLNQPDPYAVEANRNGGLKKRADKFGSSREVIMIGKIFTPCHLTKRLFPPKTKFDYLFELAKKEFFLMQPAAVVADAFDFVLQECNLYIKRVTVNPSIYLAHNQILSTKDALYPTRFMQTRTHNIPIGSFDFTFENCFQGSNMPLAIFVGFVRTNAYLGNLAENPFIFRTLNTQSLRCQIGSKTLPSIDYTMNIANNRTQQALWSTFLTLNQFDSNTGPSQFNRDNFENGAFIVGKLKSQRSKKNIFLI